MKKNFVRIVAALLVAMLALTLIPMGALAAEAVGEERGVWVDKWIGEGSSISEYMNYYAYGDSIYYAPGETIKTSDYDNLLVLENGDRYDFAGFEDWTKYYEIESEALKDIFGTDDWGAIDPDDAHWENFEDWREDTDFPFYNKDIKVPGPTTSEKDTNKFFETWGDFIYAGYVPHQHDLTCWISDGTTHWKNCTVCGDGFIHQNWCQDGDEDRICNVCGGDVPYHDIKVIETEGATVTLNRNNASHRMKITADVEAKDGYTVERIHFIKVRDDGSKQEITRYKKNGQFFTYMPTYEMEITVDVIKK